MYESNDLSQHIQQLAEANDEVAVVWLYGSRAKGLARDDSDYDLAIAFKAFIKDDYKAFMRADDLAHEWRAALKLNEDDLSIVDINHAPLYLGFDIVNEGRLLKGDDNKRAWVESARISALFEHEKMARPDEERFK